MATRARNNDARRRQPVPQNAVFKNHVFRDFAGINTQAKRQGIRENEFGWIENVMPIGHGNAVILPAASASLQTVASGTCYYMKDYNISGSNYMFMATDDGHAYQVALDSPYSRTEIGSGFSVSGLRIAQWKNERILIGDPSNGLYDWDGASLTHDTGMDAPSAISCIETFSGRVWAAHGRTIYFSAADSYADWQTASGGGTVVITDQTLHSDITQLISANNFLYFTGTDSLNVIGDVNVNAGGDTVFSNTNLSASVGTEYAMTLIPYFRSVWLANKAGVYSVFGSTPAKASDALDGIFRSVDFDNGISAASVMLENILCTVFLVQYIDVTLQVTRPLLLVYFNKKWFTASQGDTLTVIAQGEKSGVQNVYATDGTNLYQLFEDSTTAVDWSMTTALWDMGDVTTGKEANAFAFECDVSDSTGTVSVTTEARSNIAPYTYTETFDVDVSTDVTWVNNSGNTVTWQNNLLATVEWAGGGYFLNMQDTSIDGDTDSGGTVFGNYLGMTLSSSDIKGSISSMMLRYVFREQW